jgi:hypothetical protein
LPCCANSLHLSAITAEIENFPENTPERERNLDAPLQIEAFRNKGGPPNSIAPAQRNNGRL